MEDSLALWTSQRGPYFLWATNETKQVQEAKEEEIEAKALSERNMQEERRLELASGEELMSRIRHGLMIDVLPLQ